MWRNLDIVFDICHRTGDASFELSGPGHEDDVLALNYTSGTTGNPKGVLTNHRGGALNAMGMSLT